MGVREGSNKRQKRKAKHRNNVITEVIKLYGYVFTSTSDIPQISVAPTEKDTKKKHFALVE